MQRVALSESGVAGQTVQMERYEDLVGRYGQNAPGRVLVLEVNLAGSGNQHIAPSDLTATANWVDNTADRKIAHSPERLVILPCEPCSTSSYSLA